MRLGAASKMEYRKIEDEDSDGGTISYDIENLQGKGFSASVSNVPTREPQPSGNATFYGKQVETLKCALSLAALATTWKNEGVTEDNRLSTTLDEVIVYPIPAALYLFKNLQQYYIFAYVDAPGYQILKNLNIISTGVLYHIILKKKLSEIQWAAFILLCAGCITAQLNSR
ncbi:hypothetical protein CRYUN_Cryun18bG0074300 [Craigia yunnanensis]